MKQVFLTILIATFVLINAPKAQANDVSVRVCEYVKANDKKRLRSYLKDQKIKVKVIFESVGCDGDNILVFAAKNNSLEVGEFLIGKTPKSDVEASLDAIKAASAHLGEVASKRVN
ncbi:DUF3718 domain-containing protein [Thalassotalea sp. LPB0316]|uniref:DUF3718 domain-containing protein n=1 Tax=Thalassotalea sp. LPB0316 TaxID=2769490 RepID=UPI0018670232|nr:DUF3718 domain-containing protein [Thalassotalea sp. LPB0316]QOL24509.1 DUF3718 domain-containing protein [Thalassotalea sp. LPB0316]